MLDLKDETRGIKRTERRADLVSARGSRAKKLGRLAAFCCFASVCGAVVSLRSVYADAEDAAMGLGQELGRLGDVGNARAIRLNGQAIHVISTTEEMPLQALLDQVETNCREGSPAGGVFQGLSPAARKQLPVDPSDARSAGVLRKDELGEGVVACLVREEGDRTPGKSEFLARMQEFTRTGDLGAIGRLRYVYARATSTERTHVVAAWTDEKFDVGSLVPKNGEDTPGSDSRAAPRPDSAVRLLTADVEGVPYALRLYDAAGRPEQVLESYGAALTGNGWENVPNDSPGSRSYKRGPIDLLVVAGQSGERTMVSLVEMRPR